MRLSFAALLLASCASGPILVESEPPGAVVYIDGELAGQTPVSVTVEGGDPVVVAALDDEAPLAHWARHRKAALRFDFDRDVILEKVGESWMPQEDRPDAPPDHVFELAIYGGGGGGYAAGDEGVGSDRITSGTAGGRFSAFPFRTGAFEAGVSLDGSWIRSTADDLEINTATFSPLIVGRITIAGFENALKVYAAAGPAFTYSDAEVDLGPLRIDDKAQGVGVDGRVGLHLGVTDHVSVFAEYRFLYTRTEYDLVGVDVDATQANHLGLLGVAVGW